MLKIHILVNEKKNRLLIDSIQTNLYRQPRDLMSLRFNELATWKLSANIIRRISNFYILLFYSHHITRLCWGVPPHGWQSLYHLVPAWIYLYLHSIFPNPALFPYISTVTLFFVCFCSLHNHLPSHVII